MNHQLLTLTQKKISLTTIFDKMEMLDAINCVPFGTMKSDDQQSQDKAEADYMYDGRYPQKV